jgi:hypothetical protein
MPKRTPARTGITNAVQTVIPCSLLCHFGCYS